MNSTVAWNGRGWFDITGFSSFLSVTVISTWYILKTEKSKYNVSFDYEKKV